MTIADAIEESRCQNKIVTIIAGGQIDYVEMRDALTLEADDYAEAADVSEYWGADRRVHVHRFAPGDQP